MRDLCLICILILLSASQAGAQDTTTSIFQLDKIPAEGLVLDKGWKFNAGDNAQWSGPDFNDNTWISVNPAEELHHLPEVRKAGIGWFRLNIQVDSQMLGKTFAFVLSIHGATEIYLNGQLVYEFGTVSADFKKERTCYFSNKILGFKLGNQSAQVLAVRYSFNKRNLYLKFSNARPLVRIVLKEIKQAFEDHKRDDSFDSTLRSIEVSLFGDFLFLHVCCHFCAHFCFIRNYYCFPF